MLHFPVAGMLLAILLSAPFASAQQAEEAWKKLFMQGVLLCRGERLRQGGADPARAPFTKRSASAPMMCASAPPRTPLGSSTARENKFGRGGERLSPRAGNSREGLRQRQYRRRQCELQHCHRHDRSGRIRAEAMPYIRKAQETYERLLGGNSVKTASVLCMEGDAYRAMKNYQRRRGPVTPLRRYSRSRWRHCKMPSSRMRFTVSRMVYEGQGKYDSRGT